MKFNKQKVVKVLPFLMFGYAFDKISQAFQMSDGANIGAQIMNTVGNIGTVFQNPLPSFNPIDLLVGAAGGVIVKLIIYVKGKNAILDVTLTANDFDEAVKAQLEELGVYDLYELLQETKGNRPDLF